MSKWTHFWDMHSGGGQKLKWGHVFIEAAEKKARRIFRQRFHRSSRNVTCYCCGPDYSVSVSESLEQATAYHRNCDYAFFRPDGTECPKEEAWTPGEGLSEGYRERYVERGRADYPDIEYRSLPDAIKKGELRQGETFLVIRADEIKEAR